MKMNRISQATPASFAPEIGLKASHKTAQSYPFSIVLEKVLNSWGSSERKAEAQLRQLPSSFRPLMELQRSLQSSGIVIHIGCAAAESANQTIRKLQQVGGGS